MKGPTASRDRAFGDYCRQRPTLPYSFPYSTIGGSRLNFRVRNGNGCDPAPMTTGKLSCLGSPPSLAVRASEDKPCGGLSTVAPKARRWSRPKQSFQRAIRLRADAARRTATEYPANGSFFATPRRASMCVHVCPRRSLGQRKYGQASRRISIGQLNASRRLHTRPITWSSSRSL